MSNEWQPVEHVTPPNTGTDPRYQSPAAITGGGWTGVQQPGAGYGAPPLPPSAGGYGQPMAYPGYPVAVPQKKSNLVRNLVLIALAFVLLGMAGCGALVYKGMTLLRDSKPTQLAVRTAEASPFVQERIGTPLKPSMWISGGVNTSLNGGVKTGSANLKIGVKGPHGEGTLLANEILGIDGWKIVTLSFSDASGTTPLVVKVAPVGNDSF